MLLTIHTKLLFYKYLGNNPTPSIWLMPPNLIGEKVLFPNKASQQVITWITDKTNGDYLVELTPEEWNKVCKGELSLRDIPERELPYVELSFNTFLELKSIGRFIGVLPDSPKYTTIRVNGEVIPIHWNEFNELFRAIPPDTPLVNMKGYTAKINDLFIAVQYFLRVPTKKFSEDRFALVKELINHGLSGEKLHLVFSELMGE